MSEHLNGGVRTDDAWTYSGRSAAEWDAENQRTISEHLARRTALQAQYAPVLSAAQVVEGINAARAAQNVVDALPEGERRGLLAQAIAAHRDAEAAHAAALSNVARAAERFSSATSRVDRLGDVPERLASWRRRQIETDRPSQPYPADLALALAEREQAERHAIDCASDLATLQAVAGSSETALANADRVRRQAASAVIACLGDRLARDLDRALDAADTHRAALATLLGTFLGGSQLALSVTARQGLERALAEPVIDHALQQHLADYHSHLLSDAAANGPLRLGYPVADAVVA